LLATLQQMQQVAEEEDEGERENGLQSTGAAAGSVHQLQHVSDMTSGQAVGEDASGQQEASARAGAEDAAAMMAAAADATSAALAATSMLLVRSPAPRSNHAFSHGKDAKPKGTAMVYVLEKPYHPGSPTKAMPAWPAQLDKSHPYTTSMPQGDDNMPHATADLARTEELQRLKAQKQQAKQSQQEEEAKQKRREARRRQQQVWAGSNVAGAQITQLITADDLDALLRSGGKV